MKSFYKIAVFALVLFIALGYEGAHAGELNIITSSHHANPNTDYGFKFNEVNPSISYRLDNGIEIGMYKNSFYRTSTYVGYNYRLYENSKVRVEVIGGAVTGYDQRYSVYDERHYTSGEVYGFNMDVAPAVEMEMQHKFNSKYGIEIGVSPNPQMLMGNDHSYSVLWTSKFTIKM